MPKTLHIDIDLTIEDEARPLAIANVIFNYLHRAMMFDLPGVYSIDGATPIRSVTRGSSDE